MCVCVCERESEYLGTRVLCFSLRHVQRHCVLFPAASAGGKAPAVARRSQPSERAKQAAVKLILLSRSTPFKKMEKKNLPWLLLLLLFFVFWSFVYQCFFFGCFGNFLCVFCLLCG